MDAEGGKVRAVRQRVLAYLMVSIDYLVQEAKVAPVYGVTQEFYRAMEATGAAATSRLSKKFTPAACLEAIDGLLSRDGLRLKRVRSETCGGAAYLTIVNTSDDAIAKEVTPYGKEGYAGLLALAQELITASGGSSGTGYISWADAIAARPSSIRASEWPELLDALVADYWLEVQGSRVYLGLRAHAELKPHLRDADVAPCARCNEPVMAGEVMTISGKEELRHFHCKPSAVGAGAGSSSSAAAAAPASKDPFAMLAVAYADWTAAGGRTDASFDESREMELADRGVLASTAGASAAVHAARGGAGGGGGKRGRAARKGLAASAAADDNDDEDGGGDSAPTAAAAAAAASKPAKRVRSSPAKSTDSGAGAGGGGGGDDDDEAPPPAASGKGGKRRLKKPAPAPAPKSDDEDGFGDDF